MDSLQIPDTSFPGPSRQYGPSRPVSVSVQPTSTSPSQPSSRKRASHTAVSSQQQQQQQQADEQPAYRDVYSHPAAVAFAAAHPRRSIPKFGPYLLLQTLGEGEFGKVKLGLHSQWGEEVAVKLIRRGNIDSSLRMSKVEREIEVLRTLKHPNIVRLYDVIETDKYIGIILEYASGGELFDHILAHRFLKEKDAAKLFSQLVSGVWYIHQKKIVHRDLKLENLLLDRHRNVIITDFGFANRFEHRADDLMQTSCGSPCYAAPELVISEGLYVGSAVDIWSCGVILYAMLAGYLPFDDDPANPDGDNINLLYKYIVNTTLSFPDYVSAEARDLLSMMLVPDPSRRADLRSIMAHPWLSAYSHLFTKSVDDLERAAMEQHQMKRLAYQRQMKQVEVAANAESNKMSRTQSARVDGAITGAPSSAAASRSRSYREPQPEYLYESSVDQSIYSSASPMTSAANGASRKGYTSAIVLSTTPHAPVDDDPFAPSPLLETNPGMSVSVSATKEVTSRVEPHPRSKRDDDGPGRPSPAKKSSTTNPATATPEHARKKSEFRHTIQVEYGNPDDRELAPTSSNVSKTPKPPTVVESEEYRARISQEQTTPSRERTVSYNGVDSPGREREKTPRRPSIHEKSTPKPLPIPSSSPMSSRSRPPQMSTSPPRGVHPEAPTLSIAPASPTENAYMNDRSTSHGPAGTPSTGSGSGSSKQSRHRKGLSVDKFSLGKIFSSNGDPPSVNGSTSRVPSESSGADASYVAKNGDGSAHAQAKPSLAPADAVASKKSRRNTLTIMVEPISRSIRSRNKGKAGPEDVSAKEERFKEKLPLPAIAPAPQKVSPAFPVMSKGEYDVGAGMPASTTKARKVMQWFRTKSNAKTGLLEEPVNVSSPYGAPDSSKAPTPRSTASKSGTSTPGVQSAKTTHSDQSRASRQKEGSFSLPRPPRFFSPTPHRDVLRIHHGAVDQTTITTRPPPDVMRRVREVLDGMGVEYKLESEYKYRCVRAKRRRNTASVGLGFNTVGSGNGLAAFTMVGSAASNGVDKRGLPQPSQSSGGGMLRGLLMRRQSSQVSNSGMASSQPSLSIDDDNSVVNTPAEALGPNGPDAAYGDPATDAGDEVRFSVELTRIDRLNDTFSLDIRRLKGNLRSYKFLYDTIRERADLQR